MHASQTALALLEPISLRQMPSPPVIEELLERFAYALAMITTFFNYKPGDKIQFRGWP
jgi:hypothetical protein